VSAVWLNGERDRSSVEQTLLNFGLNRFGKAIVESIGDRQQLSSFI
jgi:predicted component of type VI protein secretion system